MLVFDGGGLVCGAILHFLTSSFALILRRALVQIFGASPSHDILLSLLLVLTQNTCKNNSRYYGISFIGRGIALYSVVFNRLFISRALRLRIMLSYG